MEWWLVLLLIVGGLTIVMVTGLPVAFCFMFVVLIGAFFLWGGVAGLHQLILSIRQSISLWVLLPVVLFVLLGEVMFQSGIALHTLDVVDGWLGRLPGRLSLLAIVTSTLFATMTGISMASVAMLSTTLVPEMQKRGYKKSMSLGPILGGGGLAIMIPPTSLGVLLAALAQISVGRTLIAIIIPGILMAVLYASYVIIRCWLQPSVAPPYEVAPTPLKQKLVSTVKYVLPLGLIIFLVTGVIFLGIATPTEAAATGTLGAFILAFAYRGLAWGMVGKSAVKTIELSAMMFLILAGAKAFSQILAYSGASRGMIEFMVNLPLAPILIIVCMQLIVLFMGTFMDSLSIMMITLPIYMPIVNALGFDPLWFGVIMLLNIEMGVTTPPFGLTLFVMKGLAPPDTTMGDIYKAGLPFLGCDAIVMALMLAFPQIVLWLPSVMR